MAVMTELVLQPLADAFLGVGVWVAVVAAIAACAQVRWRTGMNNLLVAHRRTGVLIAALLGVSPGCGGGRPTARWSPRSSRRWATRRSS